MIRKNQVAPKIATSLVSSTATFTIENGAPIWVYGFIISRDTSSASNDISMKTGNGAITLLTIRSFLIFSWFFDIPFKADGGLSFTGTTTSDKRVTVFYSGPGM